MRKNKTLCLMLAALLVFCLVSPVQAKTKYITASKAGLKSNWYLTHYQIQSIKGNTLKYRTARLVVGANDVMSVKFGKSKTAKLTSSTKYYIGNTSRYAGTSSKWIYKTTKKNFKKKLTGKEWWDVVLVKKGKVQKVFTKMQIAG